MHRMFHLTFCGDHKNSLKIQAAAQSPHHGMASIQYLFSLFRREFQEKFLQKALKGQSYEIMCELWTQGGLLGSK